MAILSEEDTPPCPDSISHPTHLQHKLTLEATRKFRCDGCRELGTGKACDFDLHKQCALYEGTKTVHPLLKNTEFELCFHAPASKDGLQACAACDKDVLGFHYHSRTLFLHPCCANPMIDEMEKKKVEKDEEANPMIDEMERRLSRFERTFKMLAPAIVFTIVAAITGDTTGINDMFSGTYE